MLRGLATVNIWATDVEAAAQWYAEVLGIEPYFHRATPDGRTAYMEFRFGDYQQELGILSARFAPHDPAVPGGAVVHWAVDDVHAAYERLLSLGAKEHMPPTNHTQDAAPEECYITASVVDPFGNVLGVMRNPHYDEMLKSRT